MSPAMNTLKYKTRMIKMDKFTVEIKENTEGELYIEFPDQLMEQMGWKEGDTLKWDDKGNGSFSITKKEETEWILVDTISQFRMRYLVEVPKGKAEWALDTVVCEEAKEFSQEHLGETIVSHRVVSEAEALEIFDKDNDYLKSWTNEMKMKNMFTHWGEKVNKED